MDAPNPTPAQDAVAHLAEIIADNRVAMLSTVDETGELRSRPMAMTDAPFQGDLFFFTAEHSPKVDEVLRDQQVNVVFCDPRRSRYVSISGIANVDRDHSRMAGLWHDRLKEWFPRGLQDPDLALLHVQVTYAEYWDERPSIAADMAGNLAAAFTGRAYDPGTHKKIDLGRGLVQ